VSRAALVTGAHGFIGRHASRHLARRGWRVLGLGHGRFDAAEREAWGLSDFTYADVTLASLAATGFKPDLVVHCAGGSTVGYSLTHPLQDFERTAATTAAMLEFVRDTARGARIAFLSSAAVYGDAGSQPLAETTPLAPVSPYGVHKRIGEDLCRMYAAQFRVRCVILRLFSVYGAGMRKQLLWDAANRARAGEGASFAGTGRELRDWLHVEDAASLIETAQELASADCPVLNGGTGAGVPVAQILGELFAAFGRADAPRFTGERRAGDPQAFVADIARARAAGWQPQIAWRDGVRGYAEWFRKTAA
jgi:UDP-glucose 4-epimerase